MRSSDVSRIPAPAPAPGKSFNPTRSQAIRRPAYDTANITTGSSLLGIRYNCGVMVAADTCVTYGNMTLFQEKQRVFRLNENILLGGSGDFPDFETIRNRIEAKTIRDQASCPSYQLRPRMLAQWMTNEVYGRRSLTNPLHVDVVVGGIEHDGSPYLIAVDRLGAAVEEFVVATGPAVRLSMPLVRSAKPPDRDYTAEEASQLIQQCMEVLYYRFNWSINQYLVGVCSPSKCSVEGPFAVNESWSFAHNISGY